MDITPNPGTATALSLERPVHQLDPHSPDPHGEAAVMRQHGPVVPIHLPGGVPCWTVTRDAVARRLLTDTENFSVERRHWRALHAGEVAADWPLMGLADPAGRSMITTEGDDHRYLRQPLARVFTEGRVRQLAPSITDITERLLEDLDAAAGRDPEGVADFRSTVAWPLPMTVISRLLGVPDEVHGQLRDAFDVFFDDTQDPAGAIAEIQAHLGDLVAEKRRAPGDDLTSALLALPEDQRLSDEELIATLQVVIIAGHETTVHALVHGVRALTDHPEQLALLRDGAVSWERAVEEILRWQPPTAHFMFRFAVRDTHIADVPIRQGDPVLISYLAMGRDTDAHGEAAQRFDIQRPPTAHTSFGHGPHVCIGRPLARLEARIVLRALFTRWPELAVAASPQRAPSVIMNAYQDLPVRLTASPRGD